MRALALVVGVWLVVCGTAEAQVVVHPAQQTASLSADEAMLLRERTNEAIDSAEVPSSPQRALLELEIVRAEREEIDLTGTNVLQWSGAILAIAGGVYTIFGLLGTLLAATVATGGVDAIFPYVLGPGGAAVGVGLALLASAELDDGLHRARVLDHRARRLNDEMGLRWAGNGLAIRF